LRKLHLRLYLAIVGTLVVFLVAAAMAWHHFAPPRLALGGIESATGLAAVMIDEKKPKDGADFVHVVMVSLAWQTRADVVLYDEKGVQIQQVGDRAPVLPPERALNPGWSMTRTGPTYNQRLADGKHLVVHSRNRIILHGLHFGLLLTAVAAGIALLTYPLARGITARLGRLQTGVQLFGSGDLGARVNVEGRDEVASLAKSFNESAEHIEKLVRAHQLLLANCSHELRTPLARIRLALERVPGTDPKASAEIARSIAELDALIGEMLLSSRLDAASTLQGTEPVDLLALAAEEAAYFDIEASGEAVTITANAMLLRRLVRNLLENARVHAGGATAVRIGAEHGIARIVVEDAGDGVPYIDRAKIFEPFHRASTATQSSGAGLGLAIVRQIARAHGGSVTYEPRDGGGSRFTVELPR
jgi:signal transduction histidine kinase